MKKGTRMIDIAESLNISVVTVSNALNNRGGVSPELREMIKKMADEIGYQYYSTSRTGKSESYTVGILFAEKLLNGAGSTIWQLSRKISDEFIKLNTFTINETITIKMQSEEILPKIVTENKVNAIIVFGDTGDDYSQKLLSTEIPLLFIECGSRTGMADILMIDKFNGGNILTEYLISNGHTKIGFVGCTDSDCDIYLGYIKAHIKHGLKRNDKWVIHEGDNERIRNFDIDTKDLPTSYVCDSDDIALRLINTLKTMGVNIPENVSVVSYGNQIASDMSDPPVTALGIDLESISAMAVEIIMKKLEDETYSFGMSYIVGSLVQKESVIRIK